MISKHFYMITNSTFCLDEHAIDFVYFQWSNFTGLLSYDFSFIIFSEVQ